MISLPNWYRGGFDDMELVVKTLIETHLQGSSPNVDVLAWLPEDWRDMLPLVCVARVPGAIDDRDDHDTGEVQVWCLGRSRAEAWALAECVRTILMTYRRGGLVDIGDYKANVTRIVRSQGPQLSMEEDALSERTVPLSFLVTTRRRASLPDYERVVRG